MAWRRLDEENVAYLVSTRLDFACWLEQCGAPPPVAFITAAHLRDWFENIGHMKIEPFGRIGGALRIHGVLHTGWYYDQIWASKIFNGYRRLMVKHAAEGFNVARKHLSGIDADHVVARNLLKSMPAAWVAIFPVPAAANRSFGKIEKHLSKYSPTKTRVNLTPITAFKLFCTHPPRNHVELALVMGDIRGQIINTDRKIMSFISTMENDMRFFLN